MILRPSITAQTLDASIEKGFVITSEDSLFTFRINPVLQNQIAYNSTNTSSEPELLFVNRRTRFYFYGHIFDPRLTYKIQLRLEKNDQNLYDAAFKFRANKNITVWVGMETVPAARSQLISLKYLQFVDRSIVHSVFDLQKDIGFWGFYSFDIGKSHIKSVVSVTNGEGIFRPADSRGLSYSGRIDLLPFGKFIRNGDVRGADLEREKNPKLALGAALSYNNNANANRGQRGAVFENDLTTDIVSLYLDGILKYRGFSFMGEWISRGADNPNIASNTTVFDGYGIATQMGYLLSSNIDLAIRYAGLYPGDEIKSLVSGQDDYTFVISKYFRQHHFKIQADITYREFNGIRTDDLIQIRTQISLNF